MIQEIAHLSVFLVSENIFLLHTPACLAQSVERHALNLMVVGSSPTVGV